MLQQTLFADIDQRETKDDWTFNGASTRTLTHCYHDYPARMIPQIAAKLLTLFGPDTKRNNILFDPYCGTGTSLVEGMMRGFDVIGTDLNPVARLIARAKTTLPDEDRLNEIYKMYRRLVREDAFPPTETRLDEVKGITRLEYWFRPQVIQALGVIRAFIDEIDDEAVKLFFQVAFSETVRETSNTRNSEFKLYRMSESKLETYAPDVFGVMTSKLERNQRGLIELRGNLQKLPRRPIVHVCSFNTVDGIPYEVVAPNSVDIVITSPPYGDSHTTVAYGQYSRFSAAWLRMDEPHRIDSRLMGGSRDKDFHYLPSDELNDAISTVSDENPKRALEVSAFYRELYSSISNVAKTIRPGGYACYVVGNRKVKGVVLPTNTVIRDFFAFHGYDYVDTYHRSIPNKRMPHRNSPTNEPGMVDSTMVREHIVVMKRKNS